MCALKFYRYHLRSGLADIRAQPKKCSKETFCHECTHSGLRKPNRPGRSLCRFGGRGQALRQGHAPADYFFIHRLCVRLHRPHQCRLCQAGHAGRSGVQRGRLRPGCRHLFRQLFHAGSAQQHDAGALWCPALDCAHSNHLGLAVGGHHAGQDADAVLHRALFARCCRGGFFPRRDAVSDAVVSGPAPGPGDHTVHGRDSGGQHSGRHCFGLDSEPFLRSWRAGCLAMVVLAGRRACRGDGRDCAVVSGRFHRKGALAW